MRERVRSDRKRMERSTHSTHYEVLGVQATADAAQIRAAYVRMLKRHHPDSASRDLGSAGSNVQRLVLAYTVLKDQTKRAAYDHELKHSMESFRKARVPALANGKNRRNELRPLSRKAAATLYLTVAGILAAGSLLYLVHDRSRSRVTPSPKNSVTLYVDHVPPPVSLEYLARLAARLSVPDAAAFSRTCFRDAHQSSVSSAADRCIAFDTAFLYWRQSVGSSYVAEPYFQPQAVERRVEEAFPHLDPDAAMVRAASVRASTFQALLLVVDSPSAVARSPNSYPDPLGLEANPSSPLAGGDSPTQVQEPVSEWDAR